MLSLVGEFHVEKIDWPTLKSSTLGTVGVFTTAWVTPLEWDDKVFPGIIGNAIDKLQATLTAQSPAVSGQPIRFMDIPGMHANGAPVFGFLPAEHDRAFVEAELQKAATAAGVQGFDFPGLLVSILQLLPTIQEVITVIQQLLTVVKPTTPTTPVTPANPAVTPGQPVTL